MAEEHPDLECAGINEFLNITNGEYQDAKGWFYTLKQAEQARVLAALGVINGLELRVDSQRVFLTTIVVGSSVYPRQIPIKQVQVGSGPSVIWKPDTEEITRRRGKYRNINMFMFLDQDVAHQNKQDSLESLGALLQKRGCDLVAPEHVYCFKWQNEVRLVYDLCMKRAEAAYKQEVSGAANAYVAVSLLRKTTPLKGSLVLSRQRMPLRK